jgi:hypothetical protein
MALTAGDLIYRMVDFMGGDAQGDRLVNQARRVLHDALKAWRSVHRWNWYKTFGRIDLDPTFVDGTVEFDRASRKVTLTPDPTIPGDAWPAWAGQGRIRIGSVVSLVDTRDNDFVLTLDPTLDFQFDYPPGTSYRLAHDTYYLPADFSATNIPLREDWWGGLKYIPLDGFLSGLRGPLDFDLTGIPQAFTIYPDPKNPAGFLMAVRPYPNESRTLDFIYHRTMRPVKYTIGNNPGLVTIGGIGPGGGTLADVNGDGTAFRPDMVGSVIRVGWTRNPPEYHGDIAHETTIESVQSPTDVTLTAPAPQELDGVGYTVSDPIDVEPGSMGPAFWWLCAKLLAVETGDKRTSAAVNAYEEALNLAMASDARFAGPDRAGPGAGAGRPYRWRGPITTES